MKTLAEFQSAYRLPLPELIGSDDKANLLFPTGHIGVAVSAAAHKKLWPQVVQWLKARSPRLPVLGTPHPETASPVH